MSADEGRAALVLTGGGARAAYQVGVLAAVRELRGKRPGNPFPILCGTSAGAINAVALAVHAGDFGRAVRHIERVWRCLTPDTSLIVRSDRARHAPYGLAGGLPGAASCNIVVHPDGTEEVLPAMFSTTIEAGDLYVHRMAGGGGFGDPLTREPDAVADDVRNDKVSEAVALDAYGVVIGTDVLVDGEATTTVRNERRKA